jgi:hypothetical protein
MVPRLKQYQLYQLVRAFVLEDIKALGHVINLLISQSAVYLSLGELGELS